MAVLFGVLVGIALTRMQLILSLKAPGKTASKVREMAVLGAPGGWRLSLAATPRTRALSTTPGLPSATPPRRIPAFLRPSASESNNLF